MSTFILAPALTKACKVEQSCVDALYRWNRNQKSRKQTRRWNPGREQPQSRMAVRAMIELSDRLDVDARLTESRRYLGHMTGRGHKARPIRVEVLCTIPRLMIGRLRTAPLGLWCNREWR